MQFILHFSARVPLVLPISYHAILQGFIYHVLKADPAYSSFLHNKGYEEDRGRNFKLFVFGLLQGSYRIDLPNIVFPGEFSLEVRSPMETFCNKFYHSLMQQEEYELNHQKVNLQSVEVRKTRIEEQKISIDMISPLCLHQTVYKEDGSRKTLYLTPTDQNFNELLNDNFRHKLNSIDRQPVGLIKLKPLYLKDGGMQKRDKYITRFDDRILIVAWRGRYSLEGNISDLTFAYDAGLGSRNSQGFGMFRTLL